MDVNLKCGICGSSLYNTDECYNELIFHCSSVEARFWDFERGSMEQNNAKDHWDRSREAIPNHIKKEA